MKNQKEKIDLLFRSELGGFEVAPPPDIKENVFIEMAASGMYDTRKRYLLITLLLLFISSIAIVSILLFMGNDDKKAGNTANINISKAEFSRNIIIPSNKINKENFLNPNSNNLTQKQKNDNALSENKTSGKNDNNNLTGNKSTEVLKTISDKNTDLTIENNSTKSEDNNIKNFSESEKTTDNKTRNPFLWDKTITSDPIKTLQQDQISIFNGEINSKIVQKVKSKNPLIVSLGLNAGHSVLQKPILNLYKSDNDDNDNYSYKLDWPSGSIGMNVKIEKKQFFGEFGLQVSKFSEKISTDKILTNPGTVQNINIAGQNSHIDSTGYFHYFYVSDSNVRVIDSVWAWQVDTSYYNTYDTVNETVYDTLKNHSWKNSYTFIDMPLFFGWQMNFGRFNLGIKTGPIINMLITTKGNMPIKYNNTIILSDIKEQFKKYQFGLSWQAAATLGYFMTSNLVLECSPYYRFTILGIKPVNTGAEIKNNSFGLQLGLRYYF